MNPQLSPKAIREIREGTCNPLGAPQVTTDLSENIILTASHVVEESIRVDVSIPLMGKKKYKTMVYKFFTF